MTDGIAGKSIVITGASSGIGAAIARHLGARGAKLSLAARRKDRLDALVKEIRAAGGTAQAFVTDVVDLTEVEKLVQGAVNAYGRIDVIINNAGVMPISLFERIDVGHWEEMIDVNIKGVLNGIAAALPRMIAQKGGHIVNMGSINGHKVTPATGIYSATKYAVHVISEGLRQEVKPHNIRVTVIAPGAVTSDLRDAIADPAIASAIAKAVEAAPPLPADAVARAVAYAISESPDVDVNEIILRPTAQEY